MMTRCSLCPRLMLLPWMRLCDVSRAWLVWSSAAEAALVDAYQLAGGPVLERGLIVGRGTTRILLPGRTFI